MFLFLEMCVGAFFLRTGWFFVKKMFAVLASVGTRCEQRLEFFRSVNHDDDDADDADESRNT